MSVSPMIHLSGSAPSTPSVTGVDSSMSFRSSPPRGPQLECDYDVNPSFLYQAIEAKQWDHAAKILSKSNAQTQAATWVVRKEKNGKLRWRLLPIHAAIIFGSPLELIELMLQEFPTGAQQKDDQGMLPLHLAFRNDADWEILEELLTAYPQAVSIKDRKGRTPVQCASSKTAKRASVMELYTQIMMTTERQRAVADSRAAIEARVSALQDTHVKTLQNLKTEWEEQQQYLTEELEESRREIEIVNLRLEETQNLLIEKSATESELTHKLEMVTLALQKVNEARAADTAGGADKIIKGVQREKLLHEANTELHNMVETLLEQQNALKEHLEKQCLDAESNSEKKEKLINALAELDEIQSDTLIKETEVWRAKLEDSNADISKRVKKVLENTPKSPRKKSPSKKVLPGGPAGSVTSKLTSGASVASKKNQGSSAASKSQTSSVSSKK